MITRLWTGAAWGVRAQFEGIIRLAEVVKGKRPVEHGATAG
jgi:hypothetical protein